MKLSSTPHYHAHVVSVKGRVLGSVDEDVWNAAFASVGYDKHVVIDMAKTEFMDSSAIGLLIQTAQTARAQGGEVVLANLKKRVKNMFLIMHLLGEVFSSYDSIDEAMQHFRVAAQPPASTAPTASENKDDWALDGMVMSPTAWVPHVWSHTWLMPF